MNSETLEMFSNRNGVLVPTFQGSTYKQELDEARLGAQLKRVLELMSDEVWRTLREISDAVEAPEASVSSRLRDLRKPQFGGHKVESRRRGEAQRGLWEYRLLSDVGHNL